MNQLLLVGIVSALLAAYVITAYAISGILVLLNRQQKLVIITHVGGLTKYGSVAGFRSLSKLYDKEIGFLKTARHLHEAGYWVLMFDLRNHGESGPNPNRGMSSVGAKEYQDVVAALNFVKGREDLAVATFSTKPRRSVEGPRKRA